MKSAVRNVVVSCAISLLAALPAGSQPAHGTEEAEEEGRFRRSAQEKYEEGLARQYGTRDLSDLFTRAARSRRAEVEREEAARGGRRGLDIGPLAAPAWSPLGPTLRTHRLSTVQSDDSGLVAGVAISPADPNTIFIASAGGGVWRTKDRGTTWTLVTADVGILQTGAVAVAPSQPTRVYAGTGCADASSFRLGSARSTSYPLRVGVGVLISNDGGDTWRVSGSSPASYFWQILVDPQSPGILLVAGDRGIQRSTDGGDSWVPVLLGDATPFSTRLVRSGAQPNTLLATTWGPALPGSIFKSTDNGVTWTEKVKGLPGDASTRGRIEIALSPSDGSRVYALIDGGGAQLDFARSSDGGETWQGTDINSKVPVNVPGAAVDILTKQGSFCNVMAVDPASPDTVYAGGTDLWRTTDGGTTWTWLTDWKGTERAYLHADLHVLVFGADGTLFVGSDGGLFSLSRGGESFKALNKTTLSFLVSGVCQDPNNADRIAMGAQDNGNSMRTSGTEWRETTTGDGFGCTFHATDPNFIFASTQNQNIQRSTDGGQTWRRAVNGLTEAGTKDASFGTIVLGSPSGPFRVYTATKRKIWASSDNGDSWSQLSQEMPVIDDIADFSISRTDGNRMVLMDNRGQVVVSADGGVNWQKAGDAPGLFRSRVRLDRSDPSKIYVAARDPRSERQRVWVSTTGGASWTALSNTGQPNGLPDLPINAFETDVKDANVLWAGSFTGLYRSGDGGQTWARFGQGLPNVPVMDIQIVPDGSRLRAGTFGRGVWEITPLTGTATSAAPREGPLAVPAASFTVVTTNPRPLRRVAFADASSGIPASWSWKFGDGGTSDLQDPTHVYPAAGTYNVELTATNASGSNRVTKAVTVAYPNTGTGDALTYLIPVVLTAQGQGGSAFATELTLGNRSGRALDLTFRFLATSGFSGSGTFSLPAGQAVYPDVFAFLKDLAGLTVPAGSTVGSLRIEVRGADDIAQFGAVVRVTTPPNADQRAQGIGGRFGLSFPAVPLTTAA